MPAPLRTLVYPLLLPGGALLAAAALALPQGTSTWLGHPAAGLAVPLLAGAGALLAWRFHRSRLVLGLALVLAADLALRRTTGTAAAAYTHAAVSLLLPLGLALATLLPERGIFTLRGLLQVALLAIPAAAAVVGYTHAADLARHGWALPWFEIPGFPVGGIPAPGVTAFALAALVLATRCWWRPTALEAGFLWALGAGWAALLQADPALRAGYFTAAALILVAALVEAFHFLAFRDELTGLPARRALTEALTRSSGQYTLAMVDVDHFKRVNDRYGHDVGDQVLRLMATRLAAVGGGGRAYRYGGEEFTVVFPKTGLAAALSHLERLREAMAGEPFRLRRRLRPPRKPKRARGSGPNAKTLRITVSIGAAETGPRHTTPEAVLKAADKALYQAKRGGRNQVCS